MSERLQDEHEALRSSTAKMLNLDVDNLTAAQSVRLDRCCVLRLLVSDLRGKQLRGEQINVREFVDASESLELMVGGRLDTLAAAHDFSGAKEELRALFQRRADAIERRREREAEALESSKLIPDPGSGEAQSGDGVSLPPSAAPDAPAAGSWPVLIGPPPQSAPPPERVESAEEKMSRVNSRPVPAHYLKQDEPWRSHIDANGEIISPWFRPSG
jgi:hypothetical protein